MIETLSLFRPLNQKLLSLLNILSKEDWNKKTVARNWTIKDVAAHLLDGNIRTISVYRDGLTLKPDIKMNGYDDLVTFLNHLNEEWVNAMKRVSTDFITDLLSETHQDYLICLEKLNPNAQSLFSVAWAGEEVSANWFHVAREYTEKWHHQQQIRDAVGQQGILTKELYKPVLDTFMRALPFKYKDIKTSSGACIELSIESEAGGKWWLERKNDHWILCNKKNLEPHVRISIPIDLSWRLFTKAVKYETVKDAISIEGDQNLAMPAVKMITVMA